MSWEQPKARPVVWSARLPVLEPRFCAWMCGCGEEGQKCSGRRCTQPHAKGSQQRRGRESRQEPAAAPYLRVHRRHVLLQRVGADDLDGADRLDGHLVGLGDAALVLQGRAAGHRQAWEGKGHMVSQRGC